MGYLDKVKTGRVKKNFLILLYGVEGVGKSSFAAQCPDPVFLCAEDGTENLDVARLPSPNNWPEVIDMVKELRNSKHNYKTLVVDTVDWLEMFLHRYLLRAKGPTATVQDLGAFGAYVDVVNKEWLHFINELKLLREKMNILLLAHSEVKRFSDPQENVDYDRFELKMGVKKSGALFKEFVDCLLFANFEVSTKEDKMRKVRAYSDGTRVIFTEKRASHDAKNRFNMPYELPLDYSSVSKYINQDESEKIAQQMTKINDLKAMIDDEELLKLVDGEITKSKDNFIRLQNIANRLSQRVGVQ